MATSKSRLSYPDCETFCNAALEDEKGVRIPFLDNGQARQFVVRLNYFRTICREENARVYPDPAAPLHAKCEYDELQFTMLPDSAGEFWVYARRNRLDLASLESLSELENTTGGGT